MPAERLQKLLSRRGVASRRQAEGWIEAGRVRVNGETVRELGIKVDPAIDRVEVDGSPLPPEVAPVTVVLHKPAGFVTTVRDPHAEHTVMELLAGLDRRVYPVGRLDKDTRGVLLLTDDGDLTQRLLHPRHAVEKVYRVLAVGPLDADALARLRAGVELEDGPTAPARIWGVARRGAQTLFQVSLREGRKRQVRRMVQAVGARVVDLTRVSFAGITADGLAEGAWRPLTPGEVRALRAAAGHETARRARRGADGGKRRTGDESDEARRLSKGARRPAPRHRRGR